MQQNKQRIDTLLVEKGLFATREKAKAALMAGLVRVGGELVDKAGTKVPVHADVQVTGAPHPYVSRGGLKLEEALRAFAYDMTGRVVIDVGASTGGFTDCALQHGATHVYAVDVGYGQLDWKLRQDERVTVMERTNFRHVDPDCFSDPRPDVALIDVSFISLDKILPKLGEILPEGGTILSLVKPQFEAGRESVGKKGIVRDPAVHREVLARTVHMAETHGFRMSDVAFSPITGSEGNIEFLVAWRKVARALLSVDDIAHRVEETVSRAHRELSH
ncbi:TlyA family RNA methyltransferase [Numidum massiliense]|uniref:TlyA family RNA methyltransferase n=1 Tax=Numidum massiliense TaxID=1522315 RepID=UPI0006D5598F|nr:TlyA family RNA methyltransferase [Numidum massiliense]